MVNPTNSIAYLKNLYDEHDYTVPRVHVTSETEVIRTTAGVAGCVAVIGAFPDASTEIRSFTSYRSMLNFYGITSGSEEEETWTGLHACRYIFQHGTSVGGASEVLVCNITEEEDYEVTDSNDDASSKVETGTGDDSSTVTDETDYENVTYNTTLNYNKLEALLNRMYGEIFDLLFVADDLRNANWAYEYEPLDDEELAKYKANGNNLEGYITRIIQGEVCKRVKVEYSIDYPYKAINDYLSSEFQMQRPSQAICVCNTDPLTTDEVENLSEGRYNIASTINTDDVKLCANSLSESIFSYGMMICQQIYVNNSSTPLSLINSAAYICGYLSSLNVGSPMTFRTIPGVTGVFEEVYVGPGDTGYTLAEMGVQVIVNKIRSTKEYCILNSTTPSGFDVAQLRAVSYLIRQYELQDYLGRPNNTALHTEISTKLSIVNQEVMNLVEIIDSIDSSDIGIPTDDLGKTYPCELYIGLRVVVQGVLMLIDLGVNLTGVE